MPGEFRHLELREAPDPPGGQPRPASPPWCPRRDLNPHAPRGAPAPQAGASAIPPLRRNPAHHLATKARDMHAPEGNPDEAGLWFP